MGNPNWLWFGIGMVFAMFILPMLQTMFMRVSGGGGKAPAQTTRTV